MQTGLGPVTRVEEAGPEWMHVEGEGEGGGRDLGGGGGGAPEGIQHVPPHVSGPSWCPVTQQRSR